MQGKTAHRATPDLHGGEVTVVRDRRVRKLVNSRRAAVDLDTQDAHDRPPYPGPFPGFPDGDGRERKCASPPRLGSADEGDV